jgi:flagellin
LTTTDKDKNYFVDAAGTKYYLSSGKLQQSDIVNAVKAGLLADSALSDAFSIDLSANKLDLEARKEGSDGATLISAGLTTDFKTSKSTALGIGGAGQANTKTQALDSLQKFGGTGLQVAATGESATTIASKIFEVDGHKFLVAKSDFTASDFANVDDDVTVMTVSAASVAAADVEKIAADISRVTGLDVKGYATSKTDGSNINAGDIVFNDKLNLTGKELTLQIGDTSDDYNQMGVVIDDMHTDALGITDLDISNQEGAAEAINKIKSAINQVSSTRGTLGATQNRLEHTQNNLSVMTENIQDAESTIRDTDIAEEMMSYTKNNILVQSAQAMLAQANSVPQGVLQLLQ